MASCEWISRPRNYEKERKSASLPRTPAVDHPLKAGSVTTIESKSRKNNTSKHTTSSVPSIPSKVDAFEGYDPLSMFAVEESLAGKGPISIISTSSKERADSIDSTASEEDGFEPWASKKLSILTKYTTSEKLSITTSFLSGPSDRGSQVKQQSTVTDKVKNRLEQLDDFEEGSVKEMMNLSQQDYVKRIEELNQALIDAWENDQRVKSLKIAIQCSKLLADTSVIKFYPSKFVLVTDILDTFGRLVYERIFRKSSTYTSGSNKPIMLPENFTPDQVPEQAKETCQNWFYKIASIRELIPRFYVETAILRCYSFLTTGEYSAALSRLTNMIRGIGDPLPAIYARTYLCRVGVLVAPEVRDHLNQNLYDFLFTYNQLQGDNVQNLLAKQRVEMPSYLQLYCPALDWILQCIAHKASEETLTELLNKCKDECNSALILNAIISAFQPQYIATRALLFTGMIKDCEEAGFPKFHLHRSLGTNLVLCDPPEDQQLSVLNEVWKVVMKLRIPSDYISCAEVWIEYVAKNFGKREVNTFLGDIIKHLTPDRAFEGHYQQLLSILSKILAYMHNFSALFALDKFLPFLDMLQKESVKVDACKMIMEAFVKYQLEPTNDPVVINALMFIGKTLHDSVNALTLDDEKRSIGSLITGFLRKISYGRDFELQLNLYVEARASFSNIDPVQVMLVQSVNTLAMQTRAVVKGNHSRKTAAFVRSCIAYCFITIPSIMDIFTRLQLYLLSGQVALANQALSQGDAFFKAAISIIPEIPKQIEFDNKIKSSEPYVVEYLNNFISTLFVVPDHPDQAVLYLVRGLLNVLQDFSWDVSSDAKVRIYLNVLSALSAASQESYIYHFDKVESNDRLYGFDKKFIAEVNKIVGTLISEVFDRLKELGENENYRRQSALALEFFNRLISHSELTDPGLSTLAVNLWNLAQKNGNGDTKQLARALEHVKHKGSSGHKEFSELAQKMPLQSRA